MRRKRRKRKRRKRSRRRSWSSRRRSWSRKSRAGGGGKKGRRKIKSPALSALLRQILMILIP